MSLSIQTYDTDLILDSVMIASIGRLVSFAQVGELLEADVTCMSAIR